MKIDGSRVLLSFDYTEGGLKTLDGGDVKAFSYPEKMSVFIRHRLL